MRIASVLFLSGGLSGCRDDGCTAGDDPSCRVLSACTALPPQSCDDPTTVMKVLQPGDPLRPTGPAGSGATGDILLGNSRFSAVVSAIGHPSGRSPSGGVLVDLERAQANDDGLAQMTQVAGPFPESAVLYSERVLIEEPDSVLAVQVRGVVVGMPEVQVSTRFEIHPCEDFLRIRTEVVNVGHALAQIALADSWTLGGRGLLPFGPGANGVADPAWPPAETTVPWAAFAGRDDTAAYAVAECNGASLIAGLHPDVTSVGTGLTLLQGGTSTVFERIVTIAAGPSGAPAAEVLAETLGALKAGPETTRLIGRVTLPTGDPSTLGSATRAVVTAEDDGSPPLVWASAVPEADGTFALRVPSSDTYRLVFAAFGEEVASVRIDAGRPEVDVGAVALPAAAAMAFEVSSDDPTAWTLLQIDDADPSAVRPCHPLLGSPYGASPACNRVLLQGSGVVVVPPGEWDVVATQGPFSSIDRADSVTVAAGETAAVPLTLSRLDELKPIGSIAADTHVHGSGSHDSALPDADRVASLLAAGLDVVVATDHDRTSDWASAPEAIGSAITLFSGVEATPEVPFSLIPGAADQVIGHWIAWPLVPNGDAPWGGAPPDEAAAPGTWIDRLEAYGWTDPLGMVQLPHPWSEGRLGLETGWFRALGVDFNLPFDPRISAAQGQVLLVPPQAAHGNDDYGALEVLSGQDTSSFEQQRALWHHLLNRGILHAGTGNSDSHSLLDMGPGTPRNLVFVEPTAVGAWSPTAVADAVRAGRVTVSNGPVVTVTTTDLDGAVVTPSLVPFVAENIAALQIRVTAAPWVPVDEVRVVVNGRVEAYFDQLPAADPSAGATGPLLRFEQAIPITDVLGPEDGWIVVEAGAALHALPDLDRDGIPDFPSPPTDARAVWSALAPGADPIGFTNPLLIDHDGLGFVGPEE